MPAAPLLHQVGDAVVPLPMFQSTHVVIAPVAMDVSFNEFRENKLK